MIWVLGRQCRSSIIAHKLSKTGRHCFNKIPWVAQSKQNGHHFVEELFKRIFFNENDPISINILLKLVAMGTLDNTPALVRVARPQISQVTVAHAVPNHRYLTQNLKVPNLIAPLMLIYCQLHSQKLTSVRFRENAFKISAIFSEHQRLSQQGRMYIAYTVCWISAIYVITCTKSNDIPLGKYNGFLGLYSLSSKSLTAKSREVPQSRDWML